MIPIHNLRLKQHLKSLTTITIIINTITIDSRQHFKCFVRYPFRYPTSILPRFLLPPLLHLHHHLHHHYPMRNRNQASPLILLPYLFPHRGSQHRIAQPLRTPRTTHRHLFGYRSYLPRTSDVDRLYSRGSAHTSLSVRYKRNMEEEGSIHLLTSGAFGGKFYSFLCIGGLYYYYVVILHMINGK